jgi:tripeptidyl-peptidase-1
MQFLPWVDGDTELGYFNNYGSWNYINRCETELQKLALRRRTIVSGAGDAGVSNVGESGNDLSATDPTCTPFRPFYPADSPWVLGVGATFIGAEPLPVCRDQTLYNQPIICAQTGEIVISVSDGLFWTTGGGFSSYFARYDYQNTSVNTFLSTQSDKLPPQQFWNITGQAYPDISAIGHNFLMVMGGRITVADGTSMSSPVTAGIISLLNEHVLNQGGAPVCSHSFLFFLFFCSTN